MVKIGILDTSHSGFLESEWVFSKFEYSSLYEDISPHLKLVDVTNITDLFTLIHTVLNPSASDVLDISDFYYDHEYILQAICVSCDDDKSDKYNALGSQLISGKHVNGPVLIIKRNVSLTNMDYIDLSLNEVISAVSRTFVHKGVIVKANDSVVNFKYIRDPLELTNIEETLKNVRYHETKLLDYVLTFYVNLKADRTKLNRSASAIFGKLVYGDVMVTLRDQGDSESSNLDIDDILFNKLLHLYKLQEVIDNEKYKRSFTLTENLSDESELNCFPNVTHSPNFFYVVEEEYRLTCDKATDTSYIDKYTECLNDIE
jgi:hypothetical protein